MGPPASIPGAAAAAAAAAARQPHLQPTAGSAAVAAATAPTPSWQSSPGPTRLPDNYETSVDQFSTMFGGGHATNGAFIPLPGDETMNRTFDEMLQTGGMENFLSAPPLGNGGISNPASSAAAATVPPAAQSSGSSAGADVDENINTFVARAADPTPGTKRTLGGHTVSQQKKLKTSPEVANRRSRTAPVN